MALRNSQPLTLKPVGLSDARDGTNTFPGAMRTLTNLTFAPDTRGLFTPRPAAIELSDFVTAGFNTPTQITAQLIIGNHVVGMVSTARNAGKDEPFVYDIAAAAFITINGVTAANCPDTLPTTGEWQPPKVAAITNSYIIVTHTGFDGITAYFGWFDISSFTSSSLTIDTVSGSPVITPASDPIIAGWQPGMIITSVNVPPGARILSVTPTTVTLDMNATATASGTAATVAGGSIAAPLWDAGNCSGFPLVAVPWTVGALNGRAYYGVGNSAAYSDSLQPLLRTNATQALILGDDQPITAIVGLPLSSQLTGGIVQALEVFKGIEAIFQITGDQATSDLHQDFVNGAVGTAAPNSIAATPQGLLFASPDGMRLLTLSGTVTDPIGADGEGVCVPIISAIYPSRICAAYNQDTYRITVQNGSSLNQPFQEYWFNLKRKAWTGPHTSAHSLIAAYSISPVGFIGTLQGVDAKLWISSAVPRSDSEFTENGMALTCEYQPVLLPDNTAMAENAMIESAVTLVATTGNSVVLDSYADDTNLTADGTLPTADRYSTAAAPLALTIQFQDESSTVLDSVQLTPQIGAAAAALWGQFNWGDGTVWGALTGFLEQYQIAWTQPIVFKQGSIVISFPATAGFAIGNLYFRYQTLGYLMMRA